MPGLDPQPSAELEPHLSACRSATEEVRSSRIAELRARDPELAERLERARAELDRVSSPGYLSSLVGTIGADPIHRRLRDARQGDVAHAPKARRPARVGNA